MVMVMDIILISREPPLINNLSGLKHMHVNIYIYLAAELHHTHTHTHTELRL
jgi:hypothetical protein